METFAEIQINYKPFRSITEQPTVTSSYTAAKLLRQLWSDRIAYKEEFYILILNTGGRVLGFSKIGEGGTSFVAVDVREVVQSILLANGSRVILAHNHPSGTLNASRADITLTEKVEKCLKLFEFQLDDHIILTPDSYYSFRDEGLL